MKPETLETRILKRIERKRGDVFLRADFSDLGGYDQVGRTLRGLVRKGRLVRVGQGLYARARPSILTGEPVPVKGLYRTELPFVDQPVQGCLRACKRIIDRRNEKIS